MIEDYKEYLRKKEESRIINAVLSKFPLLGVTISKLGFKPDEFCKTACTDGVSVLYSKEFLDKLTFDQKVFLFAHEIMHVAYKHIYRRTKDMNKKRWNKATDAVINARLIAEGLPMIKGGVDIPEAIDKSAEEMYRILEEKEENNQSEQGQNGENSGEGSSGGGDGGDSSDNTNQAGHDDHDIWDEVIKKLEESVNNSSDGEGKESDQNGEGGNDNNKSSSQSNDNEEENDQSIEDFEKNFAKNNRELKDQMAKDIISKLRQKAGKGAGRQEVSLGTIEDAKEVVKWKTILRREIDNEEYKYTYRRSDEDNDFQARGETIDVYDHPMTECLLDTSGSVNARTLRNFLMQLKPLLRESKLKVGCFDDEFYGFTEIKTKKDIENYRVKGRGGTSFDLALKSFSKDSDGVINKIIFTDGYDSVTDNEYNKKLKNVYWLVYGCKSFKPCVGKVIFVDEKQLKYLDELQISQDM